jgi:hypothetical protein
LPRKSAINVIAKMLASTSTKNCDSTVIRIVFHNDSQNVRLSTACWKLARPTNCSSRLATVAFDRL